MEVFNPSLFCTKCTRCYKQTHSHCLFSQVVGEGRLIPAQRADLLEAPSLRQEYTSVSCPIIEHTECPAPTIAETPYVPLLTQEAPSCDIKLVINGCTYSERDGVGIPLLADA